MRGVDATTGQAIDGEAHLRQSVIDVLSTPLGSRVLRRDYGSTLPGLLGRPVNLGFPGRVKAATLAALARWEPRVAWQRVGLRIRAPGWVELDLYGIDRDSGRPVELAGLDLRVRELAPSRARETIYRLSLELPDAPAGGEATANHVPADWSAAALAATADASAWASQRTVTLSNGVFDSATAWGAVAREALATAPFAALAALGAYVVDFTADTTGVDYWEFDPSEGVLHRHAPAGMFSDMELIWLERFRVTASGGDFTFHRGASNIDFIDFASSWNENWGVYIVDVAAAQFLLFRATGYRPLDGLGNGFIRYNVLSWDVIAETFAGTPAEALAGLASRRVIIALSPDNSYRPFA